MKRHRRNECVASGVVYYSGYSRSVVRSLGGVRASRFRRVLGCVSGPCNSNGTSGHVMRRVGVCFGTIGWSGGALFCFKFKWINVWYFKVWGDFRRSLFGPLR